MLDVSNYGANTPKEGTSGGDCRVAALTSVPTLEKEAGMVAPLPHFGQEQTGRDSHVEGGVCTDRHSSILC